MANWKDQSIAEVKDDGIVCRMMGELDIVVYVDRNVRMSEGDSVLEEHTEVQLDIQRKIYCQYEFCMLMMRVHQNYVFVQMKSGCLIMP